MTSNMATEHVSGAWSERQQQVIGAGKERKY